MYASSFSFKRALERHRIADVPAEEQHRRLVGEVGGQLEHRLDLVQHLAIAAGIVSSSRIVALISSPNFVPRTWARYRPSR